MIPGNFEFHAANTVGDALKLLNEYEDAKILAGGHSLIPMMKLRFAEPAHVVDINGIPELRGIELDGDMLVIGAMTTENELIASDLLNEKCPLVVAAAKLIADPQVRNKGTIGGDVAHGDPGNDHPAVMMALDAEFVIKSIDGERTVLANGFFLGTYWTGLEEGDLLTSIRIPVFSANTGYGYNKIKRKTGDFATAGSTVVMKVSENRVTDIKITLTNVGATALRAENAENLVLGNEFNEELIKKAAEAVFEICDPAEDLAGNKEYKSAMAAEMTRRSLRDAFYDAGGSL